MPRFASMPTAMRCKRLEAFQMFLGALGCALQALTCSSQGDLPLASVSSLSVSAKADDCKIGIAF